MNKILFVDDDPGLLLLYKDEFSDEGYQVILAENGKEAVEKFRKEKPDLIVMDIRMPVMDGIDAMNIILGKNRRAPVILNTSFSEYKQNYMTWGAEGFVLKSSDLGELKEKIREVLAKREKEKSATEAKNPVRVVSSVP
jgi:two-component system, response regulator, stage 0 sporulation protein F